MKTLAAHELQYVSGGFFRRSPGWGATIGGLAGGFFGPKGAVIGAITGHAVETYHKPISRSYMKGQGRYRWRFN